MAGRRRPWRARPSTRGFTYIGLLFAIVLLGLALSSAGTLWTMTARREREADLLWTGDQYRKAIGSYYRAGAARQFPRALEDLLEDARGPAPARHLRRLYPDPMTGQADWELERLADGSIVGVRSASTGRPIKRAGFGDGREDFDDAECYCDWTFAFIPPRRPGAPPGTAPEFP